jgi:ElaB/YqjD/DUF883 family membrane-anchored ribosome-binding protein
MNTHSSHNHPDFLSLAEDARALLAATADVAGDKVAAARKQLAMAIEKGRETLQTVQEKAAAGAKATDQIIHNHPYRAIAVGFGVGALIGYLLRRRN